ncbi:GDP-L-fucose synthase [uncultured archaeon]|nr:GDP-L-fucose synthase [uncultured archaeon]
MKVLVTGMAGLIGSNFAKHLSSKGIPVVGVDNFFPSYPIEIKKRNLEALKGSSLVEFIEGDINDSRIFGRFDGRGITHIAHLAARTGVRASTQDPEGYLRTNIIGTLNVLEFARRINAEKVLVASTSSAYSGNPVPFSEKQCTSSPRSIYAASKIGMESLVYSYHQVHGLPIIITRFFTAYGPGGRPDMAVYRFTDSILGGRAVEVYGDGKAKRDFTHVSDICEGIFLALSSGEKFNVFNLGNSEARSVRELISLIEKSTGRKAKIKFLAGKKEDLDETLADISKARKILGYRPKISLEEGIPLFVEWFKSRKAHG